MKTIQRLIFLAALIAGAASVASAGPGPQYWETLRNKSQFEQLKPGDKVFYVCNQCQTVTEKTIESTAEAMNHCTEGATLSCPSCKAKVKVVTKRERNDPPSHTEVTYVNEKGESCFFVVKAAEKK